MNAVYQRFAFKMGALILSLAVLSWGLFIIGSPAHNRKVGADARKIDQLRNLNMRIREYFNANKHLPTSLAALKEAPTQIWLAKEYPIEEFDYLPLEGSKYDLCANFETDTKEDPAFKEPYEYDQFWDHSKGKKCFRLFAG